MKTFKANAVLFLSLIMATVSIAQQAEKSLVKSFNLQGNQTLVLDLGGQVDVQTWSSKTVRVQMNISLKNRPVTFLKGMISAGRYNLTASQEDNGLKISSPGMERAVKLRTGELQEHIAYIVYAPEDIEVILTNEASSQLELTDLSNKIK